MIIRLHTFDKGPRQTTPILSRAESNAGLRIRDTVVDPDFRITTSTRINADPAPEIRPGMHGVRYDGHSAVPMQQVEIDHLAMQIGDELLLSPFELAKVRATISRFGGKAPRSAVGISSSDRLTLDEVQQSLKQVNEGRDAIAAIQKANTDFWDARNKASHDELYR